MTNTIIAGHMTRLGTVDKLETNLYQAAARWAPAGREAASARAMLTNAQGRARTAQQEFNTALRQIEQRDPLASAELARLANTGSLSRAAVGAGGGTLVEGVLKADKALRDARDGVQAAERSSSAAHGKSALLWRDVLEAADSFRSASSPQAYATVARDLELSAAPPNKSATEILERCKARA